MTRMLTSTREPTPQATRPAALALGQDLLPFVFVLLVASMTFFSYLGDYPLFNPDEGLYAEPAREMLVTGEYITTLLNYVVRFTKPPLVIWLMALSYKIFGPNEFAARFFCAASGLILVAITYLFTRKYISWKAALIAGLSLATAPLFVGTAREAITDMPLSLFIGGAVMSFFHGFRQKKRSFSILGYVLVGLAVMTKGPVGAVLPLAIMFAYHALHLELRAAWKYYRPVLGLLIVLAIAAPWFVVEIWITKGAYYQEFLVRENFQRFTSVVDHKGAWWYHLAALAGGMFPWSLFIPSAVVFALTPQLKEIKQRAAGVRATHGIAPAWLRPDLWLHSESIRRGDAGTDPTLLFCALWLAITVAFFSMSVSKLLPYTVPAFPAAAILAAAYIENRIVAGKRLWLAVPAATLAGAGALALYVVPGALRSLHDMPPGLPGILQMVLGFLIGTSVVVLLLTQLKSAQPAFVVFAGSVLALYVIFGATILNAVSNQWEGPIPWLSSFASLSGEPIVVYHMRKPSVPFYALRKVLVPADAEQMKALNTQLPHAFVIARQDDRRFLSQLPDMRLQTQSGIFALMHWRHQEH